jgi:hypothetical protein
MGEVRNVGSEHVPVRAKPVQVGHLRVAGITLCFRDWRTKGTAIVKIAFDTVVFIYAVNPARPEYAALQKIVQARDAGRLVIAVSQHSLHQLEKQPDVALDLARTAEVLPHYPINAWDESVIPWDKAAGTWKDSARNEGLRQELQALAKAGADIRDLGAYIDSLHAGVDVFMTSDKELCGTGPAKRIADRFGLRIVTPTQLASELPDPEVP